MCIGMGMLVYGLYGVYVLISGRFAIGKDSVVVGKKARSLALLCLAPFPLSAMLELFLRLTLSANGVNVEIGKLIFANLFIYASVLLVVLWFLAFLGNRYLQVPSKPGPATVLLLAVVVLSCLLMDIRAYGFRLGPESIGEATWGAALGTVLGSLGGAAFGLCVASELRRLARRPLE